MYQKKKGHIFRYNQESLADQNEIFQVKPESNKKEKEKSSEKKPKKNNQHQRPQYKKNYEKKKPEGESKFYEENNDSNVYKKENSFNKEFNQKDNKFPQASSSGFRFDRKEKVYGNKNNQTKFNRSNNSNNNNADNYRKEKDQRFYYLAQNDLDALLLKQYNFPAFLEGYMELTPMKRRLEKTRNLKKLIIPFLSVLEVLIRNDFNETIDLLEDCFSSIIFKNAIKEELEFYQTSLNERLHAVLAILNSLMRIFTYSVQHSREMVNYIPVRDVYDSIEMFLVILPNQPNLLALKEKFENLLEVTKDIKRELVIAKQKEEKKIEDFINFNDIEINYREKSIYPTPEECLIVPKKPPYFKHIIKGPYPSNSLYLNNMFHLLKEDFMLGLRNSFQILQGSKEFKNVDPKAFEDSYIYKDVVIEDALFGDNGIYLEILMTPLQKNMKSGNINWKSTKRLNYGSLLVLTDEKFETMLFSTVFDKPAPEKLNNDYAKYGNIQISIKEIGELDHENMYQHIKKIKEKKFFAIESKTYYEGYYHFLSQLKSINEENMPFEEFITMCKVDKMGPPRYLNHTTAMYYFDLSMKKQDKEYLQRTNNLPNLNILQPWPSKLKSTLDDSQFKALQNILTNKFSIIQGPPGTGKTFVGALAVKILLENTNKWNKNYNKFYDKKNIYKKPLLVVAFTNHALDQFLNHILEFTQSIVRIGGRCNDDTIKKFTLIEIRKENKGYLKSFRKLKETIEELQKIKNFLFRNKPISYNYFINNLPEEHQEYRIKDLESALFQFRYYLKNSLAKKSLEKIFEKWRDGQNLDQKFISQIVKYEISEQDNLIEAEEEIAEEYYELEQNPKYEYIPKTQNPEREEEKKEELFANNNNENVDMNNNNPPNNNNGNNFNEVNFEENDFDEEIEDPDLEENRRLENDYEENVKYFESLHSNHRSAHHYFTENEFVTLMMSNFFSGKSLWEMTFKERSLLINYCFLQKHESIEEKFRTLLTEYQLYMKNVENEKIQRDLEILMRKKIIGMTVNGCAKYSHYLEQLESPITIIEEAAEVLETHTISVLTKHTQHLIMIGDHQQLKPHIESYELEIKYNFGISLFERMINNGIAYASLSYQRRMRPDFADFIRLIYPNGYYDHDNVKNYENMKGIITNLFFFNHNQLESENVGLKSKVNKFEVNMIAAFALYLCQQNYAQEQITILSMYVGQTLALKAVLKQYNLHKIKVATVDNYQGEENDIILVSLVRSNQQKILGFVKNENRICVALSRARKGMYVFGNFDFIYQCKTSELWQKLILLAKEKKVFGDYLNLSCQNHKQNILVKEPKDFKNSPEGGCKMICNIRKECGHVCKIPCHNFQHEQKNCFETCNKQQDCGHRCQRKCNKCINQCGKCLTKVEKYLPCGHKQFDSCHLQEKDIFCNSPCEMILPCGHQCQNRCGEKCNTDRCQKKIEKLLLCGHIAIVPCWEPFNKIKCEVKCRDILPCGHECRGTCFDCFRGTLHKACQEKCKKTYICGHSCKKKCNEPCGICPMKCEYKCCEAKCDKQCGEVCFECKNKCKLGCKHSQCTRICADYCNREPCNLPCEEELNCGHKCRGICGEQCLKVCKECDPDSECFEIFFGYEDEEDAIFYPLQCGHIFEMKGLDRYMGYDEESKQEIEMNKAVQFKTCPRCKMAISKSSRYERQIKETYRHINNAKMKILESNSVSIGNIENLLNDITILIKDQSEKAHPIFLSMKNNLETFLKKKSKNKYLPREEYYSYYYKTKFNPEYMKIIEFLNRYSNRNTFEMLEFEWHVSTLGSFYLLNKQNDEISDIQWENIQAKLSSLSVFRKLKELLLTTPQLKDQIDLRTNEIVRNKYILNGAKLKEFSLFLEKNLITREEQITIIKALDLSGGHIFTCPNGHYYVIGECGGAMEESKCLECKSVIGGQNHQLVSGNRHSGDLDGSRFAAFSQEANMHIGFGNFD